MSYNMDYSLIHHSPDGTGMFLVTLPGTPDRGSYMTEQEFKEWIVSSIGGGIVPKGDILSSNLPPADASNKGWQYYCTDINKYAVSDGTAWIYFSNSPIVQTPDATDTGHALSNAVVTQKINGIKGELSQHDARLENLEQKAGDYSIVQYRGTNAVPTGKAKYGLAKSIVGKTRAWNQLIQNGNFADGTTGWSGSYPLSASDGVLAVTNASQYASVVQESADFIAGHKYLLMADIKTTSPAGGISFGIGSDSLVYQNAVFSQVGSGWQNLSGVITFTPTTGYEKNKIFFADLRSSDWDTLYIKNVFIRDLTTILTDWNSSDITTANIPLMVQQIPDLLKYNAYDAGSLVDTVVSGVRSRDTSENVLDTLSLSEPVTLRSAGSVADTDELNVEVNGVAKRRKITRCYEYTITGNETWNLSLTNTTGQYCVAFTASNIKVIGVDDVCNMVCAEYKPITANQTYMKYVGISTTDSCNGFRIYDPDIQTVEGMKAKMVGKKIIYELATYTETLSDPIPDNTILTEGGGTIETIQTQSPDIDNCLDVGYLAV